MTDFSNPTGRRAEQPRNPCGLPSASRDDRQSQTMWRFRPLIFFSSVVPSARRRHGVCALDRLRVDDPCLRGRAAPLLLDPHLPAKRVVKPIERAVPAPTRDAPADDHPDPPPADPSTTAQQAPTADQSDQSGTASWLSYPAVRAPAHFSLLSHETGFKTPSYSGGVRRRTGRPGRRLIRLETVTL